MELFRILARRRVIYTSRNRRYSGRQIGRLLIALPIVCCGFSITGCRHRSEGPSAEIRFVNTVPDAESVHVEVKDKSAFGETSFGSVADYQRVPTGSYSVEAYAKKSKTKTVHLPPLHLTLEQDHRYTGIALGTMDTPAKAHLLIFPDEAHPAQLPSDQAELRVIDAYPHWVDLDVTVNNIVAFSGLSYGDRSKPILLPASSYICKAIQKNDYADPVDGPATFNLKGGKSYELVILANPEADHTGMLLLADKR